MSFDVFYNFGFQKKKKSLTSMSSERKFSKHDSGMFYIVTILNDVKVSVRLGTCQLLNYTLCIHLKNIILLLEFGKLNFHKHLTLLNALCISDPHVNISK